MDVGPKVVMLRRSKRLCSLSDKGLGHLAWVVGLLAGLA